MKKITVILFLLLPLMAAAQTLSVEAPNLVAENEQFTVTFTVEGENKPSDFSWSQGDDFQLVWGPQHGSSTSLTIINGKQNKSVTHTFTYILLPKKTGKMTLPAATATVKGKEIQSRQLTIEVVSDGQTASSQGQNSKSSSSQSSAKTATSSDISSEDIFMKLNLSRTNVVVGEPITATIKLYQRVNITGLEDAKLPTFTGFWSQDITPAGDIQFQRENINDRIYNSAVIKRYILIPQQSGKITIDPSELVCRITVRNTPSGNSIFDGFFDDYSNVRKKVVASGCTVNVSPLPAGAPATFGGGVGKFTMTAKLSKDSLATNEAASLIVTVSGKGNISLLEAPKISFPPDFEVYDVKTSDNIEKSSGGTSGSKTYEYPFIPRSHGDFTIDPVRYSYYDITISKYVTLESGPMSFSVTKGKGGDPASVGQPSETLPSVARKGVKNLNEDIRFISTSIPVFSAKGSFFLGGVAFWAVFAILLAISVGLWAGLRKMAARKADVAGAKTRKATKMALRRLKQAQNYLDNNLYSAFYEELHKALLGYVSDKLTMSASDLSKDSISAALLNGGASEGLVNDLIAVLDACEFARYAPDSGHDAMQAHYEKAVNVISLIDSSMKKNRIPKTAVIAIVMLLSLPGVTRAEETDYPDSLWNQAVTAYSESRWSDAASSWISISDAGYQSPQLYYNIGNALFKDGDTSGAILYFERALKLDPSFSDAQYNLEIASSHIQDQIDPVPEFILKTWTRKVCYIMGSNAWAVCFLVLAALLFAAILLFLLAPSQTARKSGFFGAIVFFILAISAISFSSWQKKECMTANKAIVTRPVSSVKSSPSSESSTDLFVLHEGTKVTILDAVGEWRNIELADGRQGWIQSSDMEII